MRTYSAICIVVFLLVLGFQTSIAAASSTSGSVTILRDVLHDTCATVSASSSNAAVAASYCGASGDAQTYQFETLSDGNTRIYTYNGTNYCLAYSGSTVVSTTCLTDPSQEWSVRVVSNGMMLQSVNGTSCFADPADWNSSATTMQPCNPAANQVFRNSILPAGVTGTPPAAAACGTTPSGGMIWVNGTTGSSSAPATTQQCTNGGTVTTTWTNQTQELCTNGTLASTGQTQQASLVTAAPQCNVTTGTMTLIGASSLRDMVHDLCATVSAQSAHANLAVSGCGGTVSQTYSFYALSNGASKIYTLGGTAYCLAYSGSTVISTTCSSDASQQWLVRAVSNGMMLETASGTSCLADPADWNSSTTTMQPCNAAATNEVFQNGIVPPVASGSPTPGGAVGNVTVLLASQPSQIAPPQATINIGTNFTAVSPLSTAYNLVVYLTDSSGNTVASITDTLNEFDSTVPTTQWQGRMTIVRSILVPSVANGTYQVMVALKDPATQQAIALSAAAGVTQDNQNRYAIGTVAVQASAQAPSLLGPQTLDLTGFTPTFDDEFQKMDLSDGPSFNGSKWYTHNEQCCMQSTDGSGTFMYGMDDPEDPYSIAPSGGLDIRLQKVNNSWSSGVLTSVDTHGAGFSQQYGYFEMSAQFPSGLDTWPAFWLLNTASKSGSAAQGEIDVVEYIANPAFINTTRATLHDWANNTAPDFSWNEVTNPSDGKFHTYGLLWTAQTMTFYFDGTVLFACPTPILMQQPYYMLVDLGLGSGYSTNATPAVNDMIVHYVRAYSLPTGQ